MTREEMDARPRFDPTLALEQQPWPVWKQTLYPWGYEMLLATEGGPVLMTRRVPEGTPTDGTAGTMIKTYRAKDYD